MEFAYLDESGDPGAKGSKKIVMCLLCIREPKKVGKIIRRAKQRLLRKKKTANWYNRIGEIKFYNFPDESIIIKALKELAKLDIKIYYCCFDKDGKDFDSKLKMTILKDLFWHIFEKCDKRMPQRVISDLDFFDKKPSYFVLTKYLKKKVKFQKKGGGEIDGWQNQIDFAKISKEEYEENKNKEGLFLIKVEPRRSKLCDELQAVDLISGSIFQYLVRDNDRFYNLIKKKVVVGEVFRKHK